MDTIKTPMGTRVSFPFAGGIAKGTVVEVRGRTAVMADVCRIGTDGRVLRWLPNRVHRKVDVVRMTDLHKVRHRIEILRPATLPATPAPEKQGAVLRFIRTVGNALKRVAASFFA